MLPIVCRSMFISLYQMHSVVTEVTRCYAGKMWLNDALHALCEREDYRTATIFPDVPSRLQSIFLPPSRLILSHICYKELYKNWIVSHFDIA